MSNAIEANDLVKTYGKDVKALNGVSFNVEAGKVFGLLGPNGAGKSTTVKVLTTLSRPDSGAATVAGIDVLRHPIKVRHAIGCVTQKPGFDQDATGRENLILQGRFFGMSGNDLRQRADDLLKRFGLGDAADRIAKTYSGGMQRKLDVALGLMHRPQVLFLDEPTTGLDPEARAEMWQEISGLTRDGLTVLLTTHYLEEADNLAANLAIVDKGRIVVQGTPEELKGELKGDAIRVELHEDIIGEPLAAVAGVTEVKVNGRSLHARVDNGATALPAVLAALDSHGAHVAAVTVARPSLDDVYLRYAGRSYNTADTQAERSTQ